MKNLRDGRTEIRGHEFVKMTEMLGKLQDVEAEKQDMVTHNKCINDTLDTLEYDRRSKQQFCGLHS